MKKFSRITVLMLVLMLVSTTVLAACTTQQIDNESTRLVLAIGELDGVFNPFYSSSATDGEIVGMTQLSMLTTDKKGGVAYGKNEACAVLDYEASVEGTGENQTTTYRFVLKNNLKFSDGSPLTMKDVLFNMYVYLDPVYTGSSTMYSTEILGLAEYRTQTSNIKEQESFESDFEKSAYVRLQFLAETLDGIYENNKNKVLTEEEVKAGLKEVADMFKELADATTDPIEKKELMRNTTLVADYELTKSEYREELEKNYQLSKGTAEDINFLDGAVKLTTDTEAFLYNEGFITWNKEESKFEYALGEASKNWSEAEAIEKVYASYFPNNVSAVVMGSQTTNKLMDTFIAVEKKAHFDSLGEQDRITNVSGITFANRTKSVTVNNKEYAVPTYNADGSVSNDTNEVLQVVIKKIDPKAIWNFAFAIAPMKYYSNAAEIEKFDYQDHFGVAFGDPEFMNKAIKNTDKIGVPMGAGPYKATTRTGSGTVSAGTFKDNNVVYFERNEHFMFPAKIKYVNYQVVDTKLMLDSLFSGDIHFVEPACRQENIDTINASKKKGYDSVYVMTNGYGYIGINAEKVPDIAVRKAIMHAINVELCTQYYAGYSYSIYRPMTRASWAYPQNDGGEQYYKYDSTGETSENLVKAAKYVKNKDGIYAKDGHVLSYTFTVAGDSTDHPAYNALKNAMDILNEHGFDIKVQKDINALKKLNSGDLTVWAAAWGSGVDPDMYQVYHIDSLAGSTANWGYRAIRRNAGNKYGTEVDLVTRLSESIDRARQTLVQKERVDEYAVALDLVMQLAVELPTYQRSDLYAYNTKILDVNTLNTSKDDLTPFNGPLGKLWEVSLNETR